LEIVSPQFQKYYPPPYGVGQYFPDFGETIFGETLDISSLVVDVVECLDGVYL